MKKLLLLALSIVVTSAAFAMKVKDEKVILEKLDDYNECQSRSYEGGICDIALRNWVAAHPTDAFKAGKMTRLKMNAWAAIFYFDKAFAAKKEDCQDKDVWLAIESAAALPASYKEPVAGMKNIAFKKCFTELKEQLVTVAANGGYEKANLCPELKTKKASAPACN